MSPFFARIPSPLLPGQRFGHGFLAFIVWLTSSYLVLGIYTAAKLPSGNSLTDAPDRTAIALVIAIGFGVLFGAGLSSNQAWLGNLRFVLALTALLGTAAGLRPLQEAGFAWETAAWVMAPPVVLALWVAADAQRHASLFSGWRRGLDGALAWAEARVRLEWIVGAIGVVATAELVFAALNRYYRLVALADTTRFAQALYYTLHGRPGYETIDGLNHLGVHFTPAMGLYLPFYAVFTNSLTLLLLQSVAVGAAAIPLWFLARNVTGSRRVASLFTLLYLFHPHVQGFNINGLRESGLWPLLGFTYLLALEQERFWRRPWFWALLALTLGVKEDVPVTVAAMSLAFFIIGRNRLAHLAIIGVAAVWFVVVTKVVMPELLGPEGHPRLGSGFIFAYRFRELMPTGDRGVLGFLLNAGLNPMVVMGQLTRPDVLEFLLRVFLPLLFLPLLGGWFALGLLPGLYLTNALPNDPTMYNIVAQFIAYLVPLFYCAMQGWNRASAWFARRGQPGGGPLAYWILGISLLMLTQHVQPWRTIEPERTAVRRYLEAIPPQVRLVVPDCLSVVPAAREYLYWMAYKPALEKVDLVIGESEGNLCRGVNWGFPDYEQKVLASGQFVREPGPIPSVAVYRRKGS